MEGRMVLSRGVLRRDEVRQSAAGPQTMQEFCAAMATVWSRRAAGRGRSSCGSCAGRAVLWQLCRHGRVPHATQLTTPSAHSAL